MVLPQSLQRLRRFARMTARRRRQGRRNRRRPIFRRGAQGGTRQRADAGRKSDAQTVAMTSGKAMWMDVVTAVAETDVAVSTAGVGARPGDPVLRRHHECDLMNSKFTAVSSTSPMARGRIAQQSG